MMGLDDMNWIVDYGGFKDAPVGNGLKSWMNDKCRIILY